MTSETESLLRRVRELERRVDDLERQLAEKRLEVAMLLRRISGACNERDE